MVNESRWLGPMFNHSSCYESRLSSARIVSPSHGLRRYATHPRLSACSRLRASSNAVMMIIGTVDPSLLSRRSRSSPDIPPRCKIHRRQVLEKMEADSIADLVRMAADLGIDPSGKAR